MPVITDETPIVKTLGSANHWQVAETRIVTPAQGDPFISIIVQAIHYTPADGETPAQYQVIESNEVMVRGADFAALAGSIRTGLPLAADIKQLEYDYLMTHGHIPSGTIS